MQAGSSAVQQMDISLVVCFNRTIAVYPVFMLE